MTSVMLSHSHTQAIRRRKAGGLRYSPYARCARAKAPVFVSRPHPVGTPSLMGKLPTEIRAKIFMLLMPSKSATVVPVRVRGYKGLGLESTTDDDVDPSDEFHRNAAVLPLLLVCKRWCAEVCTILYEEYKFEMHIHASGVDFLDLPRIPHLQDFATAIQKGENRFGDNSIWSFARIRHFKLVFWAADPKERLAATNMRASTEKIVALLLGRKDNPPLSVDVAFESRGAVSDSKGTFWVSSVPTGQVSYNMYPHSNREARGSIMHGVSNVELVSAPLKNLRDLSRVSFELPDEINDEDSLAYASEFVNHLKNAPNGEAPKSTVAINPEPSTAATNNILHFGQMIKGHAISHWDGDNLDDFNAMIYDRVKEELGEEDIFNVRSEFCNPKPEASEADCESLANARERLGNARRARKLRTRQLRSANAERRAARKHECDRLRDRMNEFLDVYCEPEVKEEKEESIFIYDEENLFVPPEEDVALLLEQGFLLD